MDWEGLTKEEVQLGLPLLVIKGSKGFLGCGYINVETCNKTGEACAVVTGENRGVKSSIVTIETQERHGSFVTWTNKDRGK